jgi:YD repeat-containing protein
VISFTYDGAGRVLIQTDAENGVTTYVYDRRGNAVKITNALGGVTERTYDRLDRLIKETVWFGDYGDPNSQKATTTFHYDKNGNLIRKVEGGGLRTTLYQYDGLNRLTRITPDAMQPALYEDSRTTLTATWFRNTTPPAASRSIGTTSSGA